MAQNTKIIDGQTWVETSPGRWSNVSAQQQSAQAAKDLAAYRASTGGVVSNVQVTPVGNQTNFSAQSAVPYSVNSTTTLPVGSSYSSGSSASSSSYQWAPTGESMTENVSVVKNLLKGLPAGTTASSLKTSGPISVGGYYFGYDPAQGSYYYTNRPNGEGKTLIGDFEIGSGANANMFRYGGDWYNSTGQKVQQQQQQVQQGTSQAGSFGNPQLDQLYKTMESWLTSLKAQGKVVNPNIEITPELMKGFLDQAENEINPYYRSQFSAIKSDLQSNLDYLAKDYELNKQSQQAQFRNQLGLQRETEAEKGTLFSGGRRERANNLTSAYNRQLQSDEMGFLNKTQGLGTTAERTIGSSNLADIKPPTVNSYQARTLGEGNFANVAPRSLFSPTSGITGSLEREQLTATNVRQRELESGYRTKRGIAEQSGTVY